jgi:hypothetical protein
VLPATNGICQHPEPEDVMAGHHRRNLIFGETRPLREAGRQIG